MSDLGLEPLAEDVALEADAASGFVLTASFLVARSRVGAFDEAMDDLARGHTRRIRFKYLGPLAPHSFVALAPEER